MNSFTAQKYLSLHMANSRFWRSVLPYFWTIKYEFLYRTVGTFFDEKSLNKFYLSIIVVGITYIYLFYHLI